MQVKVAENTELEKENGIELIIDMQDFKKCIHGFASVALTKFQLEP